MERKPGPSELVSSTGKAPGLERGLGLWSAIAVVMGAIIGSAIFLVPSDMARDLGSATRVLAVWAVGGGAVIFGTLCYAELGAAMPHAGGDYVYLGRGLGPAWGFSFGWMTVLIQRPASTAALAAGLLRFVGFIFPSVAQPLFTLQIPAPFRTSSDSVTLTAAQLWAVGAIAAMVGINYFGIRSAGRVQSVLTGFKVLAVASIILLGLLLGHSAAADARPAVMAPPSGGFAVFLTALVPVMFAYVGFSSPGAIAGEIVAPQTNLPRAAIIGVLSVVILYTAMNVIYFRSLGVAAIAQSQHVASDLVALLVGRGGAKWITLAMMISALGGLHANLLTGPRITYAMAHDGQFFRFAERIHPVFHTPGGALLFQGCLAALLVLTGTFEELVSLIIFSTWMFYSLTAVALIRLRRTEPALDRPYQVWGYPWTPLIFAVVALAVTVNLWLFRPVRSSIGLAVIVLGLPFFYHWRNRATFGSLRAGAVISVDH